MTPTQAAGPGPNADPTLTSAALHRDLGDVYGDPAPMAAPLAVWRAQFTSPDARFQKVLRFTYGDRAEIIGERCALFLDVLGTFAASFGDEGKVCVVGVPSRINWEGHHVDHQGGSYNATTHCREMLLVARPRQDRVVRLVNANPERFCSHEFSLDHAPPRRDECRDWSNYVRGAFAALEQRFPGRQLLGADIAVASDIPVGASLSSSHALVLGSALCGLFSNGLVLDKREAVILVRDGEWATGSRTGLGDQAAMVFGRRGQLFSSPVVERDGITPRYVALPSGCARLIIDSFTEHRLSGQERMGYNARVFAYRAAYCLVLSGVLSEGAARVAVAETRRLADIRPDRFPTEIIYRALRRLPDTLTMPEARRLFESAVVALDVAGVELQSRDFEELVSTYFGEGPFPETLAVKGVALYGLAECWRSRLYADLLERGHLEDAGRLVNCGHDGDRVARRDPSTGRYVPFSHPITNRLLDKLLARIFDRDPETRTSAALQWQEGDYSASIPELDMLVDLCRDAGALSASLTGAGLGGVVTTVITESRVPALREALLRHYEETEDAEVAKVVAVVPPTLAAQVRQIRDAKREACRRQEPYAPTSAQREALADLIRAQDRDNDISLRLLPVDYITHAIARNFSVAGAGFMPSP